MARARELFELLLQIRWSLDDHNQNCKMPARSIVVHPELAEFLNAREIFGLEVVADEEANPNRIRIGCEGSAWRIEDRIAEWQRN